MLQEFVSLGDEEEVVGKQNVDTTVDDEPDESSESGLADVDDDHDAHEGDEDEHDDELAFHGAHDLLGVLKSVFLEPLVPAEGDVQWPGAEDKDDDAGDDVACHGADGGDDAEDTADHGEDGHDLHTGFDWNADAALLILEFATLEHMLFSSWLLKHF